MPMQTSPRPEFPRPESSLSWRVHSAIDDWGARADWKASVLQAHQGGGFVLSVTAFADRWSTLTVLTVSLLLLAMCASAAVLYPVAGSAGRRAREHGPDLIAVGHLRRWTASALAAQLGAVKTEDEPLMVSAQLIALSRLNWRKHRLVQISVVLMVLAMVVGMAALATTRIR